MLQVLWRDRVVIERCLDSAGGMIALMKGGVAMSDVSQALTCYRYTQALRASFGRESPEALESAWVRRRARPGQSLSQRTRRRV